jgi:large subunit ribosomal protein L10
MSKVIKQMEMKALHNTFQDVRDLVVLSIKGLSCQAEHTLRTSLRKKNIRLQMIKNSLTRRVFGELGIHIGEESPYWQGPTVFAWGGSSAAELGREVQGELRHAKNGPLYKDKVTIKGGVADGLPIAIDKMVSLPTRQEAIARVIGLALSPASRVVGQILGPASRVAGQINTIRDKEEAAAPTEPAAPPPPA